MEQRVIEFILYNQEKGSIEGKKIKYPRIE